MDAAFVRHIFSNLPRSKNGFVVFLGHSRTVEWDSSGVVTYCPRPRRYVDEVDSWSEDESSKGNEDDFVEGTEADASPCTCTVCIESLQQAVEADNQITADPQSLAR